MKVLGRELATPFDYFWEHFKSEIPVPVECIEEGHSVVFGAQGADVTAPTMPAWASLPEDDLAYHVAHELTHIVLKERGFPRTGRGNQYPEDSAEARIGGDIDDMVSHPSLHKLMEPFTFTWDLIRRRMVEGVLRGLCYSPVPEDGTPWFFTWAIRYCELNLELPNAEWLRLEETYKRRSLNVSGLGRELVTIMREVGWGSRGQALESMVRVRDALGLGVEGRVLVIDQVSGKVL